jgi:outer membrane protein assembly factor BamB
VRPRLTTVILICVCLSAVSYAQPPGVSALPIGAVWTRPVPFGDDWQVVVGSSRVVLASRSHINTVSATSGEPAWSADLAPVVAPTIADGQIFVATADRVVALAELTGRQLWSQALTVTAVQPVARAGWLLVIDTRGHLTALRASDGARIWTSAVPVGTVMQPPTIDGERVFTVADGGLTAWRITDGAQLWTRPAPPQPRALLAAHGRVYVAADDFLTSWAQDTGDRKWSYPIAMPVVSRLTADQTHVYVATLDNTVRAHRASNGHQVWKARVDARVVDGLLVDAGVVLVPQSDGTVRLLLAATGRRAGELAAPAATRGVTALVSSGFGASLRLARLTVGDSERTVETFVRQGLTVTAATTLTGLPLTLTPPGDPRH